MLVIKAIALAISPFVYSLLGMAKLTKFFSFTCNSRNDFSPAFLSFKDLRISFINLLVSTPALVFKDLSKPISNCSFVWSFCSWNVGCALNSSIAFLLTSETLGNSPSEFSFNAKSDTLFITSLNMSMAF